ncbi:MAG: Asp-tRNA(Asn)/Glu-tRNA(Gln) amidotransferase subunit GatB [Candidatus Methanomethylophilaceae archaeon]|nr:Asp-tRNA(Asn)/Glu-tRNA(Gln) amidotransferase subunit GatB [Candidatus Methanomethylophilaceae archaeon]
MRIGLEIHVQLPTRSKMFCSCPTTSAESPNTHVCPTCLGMPGSRPVLNRRALELGLTIAKMLGCSIPDTTWFSRKTYFYPDLCKHFQITQYDTPIGEKGVYYLGKKPIRITRVHLEEDPGKTKRVGDQSSLVDYNRSGIPLVEIVTEPDMSTPAEAREFLSSLIADIRHAIGLQECDERSIRCDCNISVKEERCEVKNVTGLKNCERALMYEAVRQTKVLKAGGRVERETRRFDEERKVTLPARKKELEADYGYIGEPDLGVYHIGKMAEGIKVRESPQNMIRRLAQEYGIETATARQLVSTSVPLAEFFETLAEETDVPTAVTWTAGVISANWKSYDRSEESDRRMVSAVKRLFAGEITDTECSIILKAVMTGTDPEEAGRSSEDLDAMIGSFLDANPSIVEDYRKNEKAANRIIGHVMKETGGAHPSSDIVAAAKRILESRL